MTYSLDVSIQKGLINAVVNVLHMEVLIVLRCCCLGRSPKFLPTDAPRFLFLKSLCLQ